MTAITEGAIDRNLAGLWVENGKNLGNHDRPMRTGGRFSGSEHFRDRCGVTLG